MVVKSCNKCRIDIPLMVPKILYCLKKVEVWSATGVMVSVTLMILGNSVISRDFVLHCHFLE